MPMCGEAQKTGLNIGRSIAGLLTIGLTQVV